MAETPAQVPDLDEESDVEWGSAMLFGREPSAAPPTVAPTDDDDALVDDVAEPDAAPRDPVLSRGGTDAPPVDLDIPADGAAGERLDVNAGAKKTAAALGAAVLVAVAAIAGGLTMFGSHDPAPPEHTSPPGAATPLSAAPSSAAPVADSEQAIPFTASAPGCREGSTSAQSLTDTAADSAWVCVRGVPGAQVDGQVLHIELGPPQRPTSYLVTSVAVTPGWVAKTAGGKDEWLAHRVVSRLQYVFNDTDRTVFTQDTANTHGPVTVPLPRRVLASRVTVIIQHTSRPPASPQPGTDPPAPDQPGFVDSVLGRGNGPPDEATQIPEPDPFEEPDSDPVDATFAMSALTFYGHQPN